MVQIRLRIDGSANVQRDILDLHVSVPFAKIILVTMVERVLNSLEVDICACVPWENMDIIASTVRVALFQFLCFF
jgi:hypothetical protein